MFIDYATRVLETQEAFVFAIWKRTPYSTDDRSSERTIATTNQNSANQINFAASSNDNKIVDSGPEIYYQAEYSAKCRQQGLRE